jgi:AcrR family transcriptional regulator
VEDPLSDPLPAEAARRPRARRGEGDRLREEILAAAEHLLLTTGDAEKVSIRALADAVGVTPPSIYLHFADKMALLRTVCELRFAELEAALLEAAPPDEQPLDILRRKGRAYVQFGRDHPEHYRLLFMVRHEGGLEDFPVGAAAFLQLVQDVQRYIDAGVYAPADPVIVATSLWTTMHGLTSLLISLPKFPWPDIDTLVDHTMDVQARGLAVDSPRREEEQS